MEQLPVSRSSLSVQSPPFSSLDIIDKHKNLNLQHAGDAQFLDIFFRLGIQKRGKYKTLSENTLKAYRQDAQTLFHFLEKKQLTLTDIGFPEVYAYNEYINQTYAARTAIRKLDFFRRLLQFGYRTQFYSQDFSVWIEKPSSIKGHYGSDAMEDLQKGKPARLRQLDQPVALGFSLCFKLTVKNATRNKPFYSFLQTRNELIGYLLYGCGLRASEICNLDFYHFRKKGNHMNVDVVGKGNKHRVVPIREKGQELFEQHIHHTSQLLHHNVDIEELPVFFSPITYKQTNQITRMSYYTLYKICKNGIERAIEIVEQDYPTVREKLSILPIENLSKEEKEILHIGKLLHHNIPTAAKHGKISPHWFRHTYVTMLLERGVPLATVKDLVGHADISTTNLYLEKINEDKKHEQLDGLDDLHL